MTRLVVIGGTGLIGSKVVALLARDGHDVVTASPQTGVDTLTGHGLGEALAGAQVVIDVSNSPSWEDAAVLDFFTTSTRNLLHAEQAAGVTHHVALSVVGTEDLQPSGYFRAKLAQEQLIKASGVRYSIVRATQFFEFVAGIADLSTDGDTVRASRSLIQPISAGDVAAAVSRTAVGRPLNGTLEIAGPEQFALDDLMRILLARRADPRHVVTDPQALYFGAPLHEHTLVPGSDATVFATRFLDWLSAATAGVGVSS